MITRADSKLCFVILERSSPSREIKPRNSVFHIYKILRDISISNILAIYSKGTLYNKLIKQMNTFRENSRL